MAQCHAVVRSNHLHKQSVHLQVGIVVTCDIVEVVYKGRSLSVKWCVGTDVIVEGSCNQTAIPAGTHFLRA